MSRLPSQSTMQQSYRSHLEPVLGESVVRALTFHPSTARAFVRAFVRAAVMRPLGKGGLNARIGVGGNFAVVTETDVVLLRGLREPFATIGSWPRGDVRGVARRKHFVTTRRTTLTEQIRTSELWVLRTTLQTPDGDITVDFDEQRGGRAMLKALSVAVPPLKPSRWWRSRPFE